MTGGWEGRLAQGRDCTKVFKAALKMEHAERVAELSPRFCAFEVAFALCGSAALLCRGGAL